MRLDDRVTIGTPEGVQLELVLAGLGSRFIARLLDSVIQLGDLTAGTLVLRDNFPGVEKYPPPITVPAAAVVAWDVSALGGDDVATIRQFLDRRLALKADVRTNFANALAAQVAPKVAGAPYGSHPEHLLEGVIAAKSARA